MTTAEIRQRLTHEIERIPDDRLKEVFDVLHYFRLGLESADRPVAPAKHHRQSVRLAWQGARLKGDDMAPAIPLADWGSLYEGVKREQAQSGRSNNVSEVVRAEIAAGRASGPARPAEDVFDRLEAKYSAQAGSQQR